MKCKKFVIHRDDSDFFLNQLTKRIITLKKMPCGIFRLLVNEVLKYGYFSNIRKI